MRDETVGLIAVLVFLSVIGAMAMYFISKPADISIKLESCDLEVGPESEDRR